jgi:hypothetical protein
MFRMTAPVKDYRAASMLEFSDSVQRLPLGGGGFAKVVQAAILK